MHLTPEYRSDRLEAIGMVLQFTATPVATWMLLDSGLTAPVVIAVMVVLAGTVLDRYSQRDLAGAALAAGATIASAAYFVAWPTLLLLVLCGVLIAAAGRFIARRERDWHHYPVSLRR